MHARMTTLQLDPNRIDDAVKQVEEQELPGWKDFAGFRGFTLFADRASGKVVGISYWDSAEEMDATEEQLRESRQRAADTGGASSEPQGERFEGAVDSF